MIQFLDRHGPLLTGFKARDGNKDKDSNSDGSSGGSVVVVAGAAGFALKVLEDITAAFLQQVQTVHLYPLPTLITPSPIPHHTSTL